MTVQHTNTASLSPSIKGCLESGRWPVSRSTTCPTADASCFLLQAANTSEMKARKSSVSAGDPLLFITVPRGQEVPARCRLPTPGGVSLLVTTAHREDRHLPHLLEQEGWSGRIHQSSQTPSGGVFCNYRSHVWIS